MSMEIYRLHCSQTYITSKLSGLPTDLDLAHSDDYGSSRREPTDDRVRYELDDETYSSNMCVL